ncbi:MAG: hypothetical protein EON54_03735, partial [Alcaligenaceae bacterium]
MIESLFALPFLAAMSFFFYLILFFYFSIPNLMASSAIVALLKKSKKYKKYRNAPFLFPVIALAFYSTVDFFEANNIYMVWFVILGFVSLAPVAA